MDKIKVSIIIPVYNVEKYLAKCLDSIINQTLKDIEIICVNDGSTDNSLEILTDYAISDSRVIIINQKNAGLSAARNTGIDAATGEYIGFVDSDDWVDTNFYENLYNEAVNNQCDIAVAGIIRHYKQQNIYDLKFINSQISDNLNSKFKLSDTPDCSYVWNKIYKTAKIKEHNLKFPVGKYYEDQYFTPLAFLKSDKLITVPEVFYHYRRHSNSIVKRTKNNAQLKQQVTEAFTFMENFITQYNIDTSHCKKVKKYKILGITFLKSITKLNKKTNILLNCIKWDAT